MRMVSRLRVGIIGLRAGQGWAAKAHLPALRALPQVFEVAGVANSSRASAEAAAAAAGIPRAFGSVSELVASPDIDLVTVTVRVPQHLELVSAALEAGKPVYCEWPLGNGLGEAEALAALAQRQGVVAVAGMQARVAPEVQFARSLIADGFVGEVLSSTLTAWTGGWGATIDAEANRYLLDRSNGATMLSIPVGHTLAAVGEVLGPVSAVSALVANRRTDVTALDTGRLLPMTSPDQVLLSAELSSGALLSLHYRGGMPRGTPGLVWDINGTRGDLRITGPLGHAQLVPLSVQGATTSEPALHAMEVPASFQASVFGLTPEPGNVARLYARLASDLRDGSRSAPSFQDAVRLHRLLEAVEDSAASGQRVGLAP
jgi:predicted dehydrogenase